MARLRHQCCVSGIGDVPRRAKDISREYGECMGGREAHLFSIPASQIPHTQTWHCRLPPSSWTPLGMRDRLSKDTERKQIWTHREMRVFGPVRGAQMNTRQEQSGRLGQTIIGSLIAGGERHGAGELGGFLAGVAGCDVKLMCRGWRGWTGCVLWWWTGGRVVSPACRRSQANAIPCCPLFARKISQALVTRNCTARVPHSKTTKYPSTLVLLTYVVV